MAEIHNIMPWFFPVFMVVFGGVFGSFLTCCLYRVPRHISLRSPASSCPSCHTKLGAKALIPILSYLIFKGRCCYCQTPISPRYLFIELLSVFLCLFAWFIWGPQLVLLVGMVLFLCLQFAVLLFAFSRKIATKVLLFSIILLLIIFINY